MLYGVTSAGGTGNLGTVFRIATNGSSYAVIRNFTLTNGSAPLCRLIEGTNGWLYGTTSAGGASGAGTVFQLSKDGSRCVILHAFGSVAGDGSAPQAGLAEGSDGVLYGTTANGGSGNVGTVFKLNQDGSGYSVLHSFVGFTGPQGAFPFTSVLPVSEGALYGTTAYGGANGLGVLFKVNSDGSGYTVLHSFTGPDGRPPLAELIEGADGRLYGTTYYGGTNDSGTVFELNKDGTGYSVLYHFAGDANGGEPFAGLVQGPQGTLFGTASYGGTGGLGTAFRLNPDGSGYTVLHRFSGGSADGGKPAATLWGQSQGALYGTTLQGGQSGAGTVFKLFVDLADSTPLVINMLGTSPLTNECSHPFTDPGATASESYPGLACFWTNSAVNPNAIGCYCIQYIASDLVGNSFTNTRTVFIQDTIPPVITNCAPPQVVTVGPNGTASLSDLTALVTAGDGGSGTVTIRQFPPAGTELPIGTNVVMFFVDDGNGNTNTCSTTVAVNATVLGAPVISSQAISGGMFQLSFSGPDGQRYRVLATTNPALPMASWAVLTNGTFAGSATFVDPTTAANQARFYRVRSP